MEILNFIYILVGILFLYLGGEWILNGTLSVADKLGVSKVFSSVVLMGFGTSAPELFVSMGATINGSVDIAIGNIMGSNIANILLVSGLGILICPLIKKLEFVGYESTFFILSAFIPALFSYFYGGMSQTIGWLVIGILFIYFFLASTRQKSVDFDYEEINISTPRTIAYLMSGLLLLVIGSHTLIQGAVNVAISFGVSQSIIGLSMVAIGTSLPEIATTISSARRGEGEMIIGNVLGSNLFNTLLVLGAISTYEWIDLTYDSFGVEMVIVPILSVLFVIGIYSGFLRRSMGIVALIGYALYIGSFISR